MTDGDDRQLLGEFTEQNSETAFRALVDRHAGMVYHTALRQVGNPHIAEEVTQAVFIALAQKASKIPRGVVLSGWLFRATRFAVSNLARTELRRQLREQEALLMQSTIQSETSESDWEYVLPHLNGALDALSSKDREAILIRFFEAKSHQEVARALGVTEDAAKMRVSRALEKLRLQFAKQGLVVPSAVVAATLSVCNAQAAPAGLGVSIAASVAQGSSAGASTFTLAKEILKLMAWSKTKIAVVSGVALLLVGATTTVVLQQHKSNALAQPTASVADQTTPKGTLQVMAQGLTTGDAPMFLGCFDFVSPDEDAVKASLEKLVLTIGKYHQAAIKQFGAAPAQASFSSLPFILPAAKIAAARVEIEGEQAGVRLDPRDRPALFKKSKGEWKTTPESFFGLNPASLEQETSTLIATLERVMAGIKAGDYATATDAAKAARGR